ncbi:hypothetical protein [Gemmobacter sp. 24YEA27]|nr:hypothetical protein [Gemmobacter sp. 24YEA27]
MDTLFFIASKLIWGLIGPRAGFSSGWFWPHSAFSSAGAAWRAGLWA